MNGDRADRGRSKNTFYAKRRGLFFCVTKKLINFISNYFESCESVGHGRTRIFLGRMMETSDIFFSPYFFSTNDTSQRHPDFFIKNLENKKMKNDENLHERTTSTSERVENSS